MVVGRSVHAPRGDGLAEKIARTLGSLDAGSHSGPWVSPMDPALPVGLSIVAVALAAHVVLVFVSRGIVERMHRSRAGKERTRG